MLGMKKSGKILTKAAVVAGTFLLTLPCAITPAYAKTTLKEGLAFVTGSQLRLRATPTLTGNVLDYAAKNDIVVVVGEDKGWYHVIYNNQEGYMSGQYLNFVMRENAELGYGKVSGDLVNVRSRPTTDSSIVTTVTVKDAPYIIGINDGWYKVVVKGKVGYMRSDYLELTEIPYENADSAVEPLFIRNGKIVNTIDPSRITGNTTIVEKPAEKPVETPAETPVTPPATTPEETTPPAEEQKPEEPPVVKPTSSEFGAKVVAEAEKYLGIYYKWGGTSPSTGFDCSGFVYYVFNQCGYPLSRIMSTQYKQGTPVEKSELQPGDIVFFQGTYASGMSHTGIYVGNGKFIHSPSTGKTISYADINSDYYTAHWYGACRITP